VGCYPHDPAVAENYEKFFEWIAFLLNAVREPFRNILKVRIEPSLIDAMAHLSVVIGGELARLLESR
jgi:hypothetical protein